MDTMSAVMNAAETWFRVFVTALACWMTLLSSELMPHVFIGVVRNWMPSATTV